MDFVLYIASSLNGFIAKENDETPWSEEEWEAWLKEIEKAGALIIGRRTYEIMEEDGSLGKVKAKRIYVLSSKLQDPLGDPRLKVLRSVSEVREWARRERFNKVIIGGGSQTISSFIKEELIDKVILDFEPFIFDKGIPVVLPETRKEIRLELEEVRKIGWDTVQARYKVRDYK